MSRSGQISHLRCCSRCLLTPCCCWCKMLCRKMKLFFLSQRLVYCCVDFFALLMPLNPTGWVAYIFKNFNWFQMALLLNVAYKSYYRVLRLSHYKIFCLTKKRRPSIIQQSYTTEKANQTSLGPIILCWKSRRHNKLIPFHIFFCYQFSGATGAPLNICKKSLVTQLYCSLCFLEDKQ